MAKKNGGPAYPYKIVRFDGSEPADVEKMEEGMSLRDWFAGLAMQATITNNNLEAFTFENRASYAYFMADAMIEQKRQGEEKQ